MRKGFLSILYKGLTFVIVSIWILVALFFGYLCLMKTVYPLKYREEIIESASVFGIEPSLICAFIKVESDFNPNAVSNKKAIGLMQITSSTGEYIANLNGVKEYNLKDAKTNIKFGCFYINYLSVKFSDINTVICAYNAGEGNVSSWLKNKEYSQDGTTLKSIPFTETKEYLTKIKKTFEKYKKLYGNILDKRQKIE